MSLALPVQSFSAMKRIEVRIRSTVCEREVLAVRGDGICGGGSRVLTIFWLCLIAWSRKSQHRYIRKVKRRLNCRGYWGVSYHFDCLLLLVSTAVEVVKISRRAGMRLSPSLLSLNLGRVFEPSKWTAPIRLWRNLRSRAYAHPSLWDPLRQWPETAGSEGARASRAASTQL